MKEVIYHKIPETISPESLRQLKNIENMPDENIDYTDIPPLQEKQLQEIARILTERKKLTGLGARLEERGRREGRQEEQVEILELINQGYTLEQLKERLASGARNVRSV
jgi:hypothetical protein